MTEILARISAEGGVELIDDKSNLIEGIGSLSPNDAAYLARGILACAAGTGSQPPGTIGGDVPLVVSVTQVGANRFGQISIKLTVLQGTELTFVLSPEAAKSIVDGIKKQPNLHFPPENPGQAH